MAYIAGAPNPSPKKVRRSKVLAKIAKGECPKMCACGHYLPFFVHYAAESGYDCIWFDLEHRAMGDREVQSFLQMCYSFDIDCLVRTTTTERGRLYRYFEDGATGVMVPLLKNAAEVTEIVEAVKFPPIGNRGMDGAGVDAGFGSFAWAPDETYVDDINRETFVIIQIERREALMNLDSIAAVPGINGFFVGPGDLGLRLSEKGGNVPSDPYYFDGDLAAARALVNTAAKKNDLFWGLPAADAEAVELYAKEGAQLINLGGDFAIFALLQDQSAVLDTVYAKL